MAYFSTLCLLPWMPSIALERVIPKKHKKDGFSSKTILLCLSTVSKLTAIWLQVNYCSILDVGICSVCA